MGGGFVQGSHDEEAKTLTRDRGAPSGGADGEDVPDSLPGLEAILGANLRGELHELGPGMIVDDKWELLAQLGEGSFGRVFEARHVKLGHRVAIKVLTGERLGPRARQRFLEEAQLMAGLGSEHLVRASDYDELQDGTPYFVMDLVKGRSLRHVLRERPTIWRAVELGEQILAGLVEVHRRGVVHGDIKPENVVIGEDDDKARLLDFGLARTSADEPEGLGGTPCYMAPEMLLERAPATVRTDVYAAGVVLYEMLTGRLPRGHLGMDVAKIRAEWEIRRRADPVLMHCKDVPQAQREALETLDRLVMEALAPEPTARPKSAVPMLEELRKLRKRLSSEAYARTLTAKSGPAKVATEEKSTAPLDQGETRRRRWLWPAVAVFVVVVGIVGWWIRPKEEEPLPEIPPGLAVGGDDAGARSKAFADVQPDPEDADLKAKSKPAILVMATEGANDSVMKGYATLCRTLHHCSRVSSANDAMSLADEAQARLVVLLDGGESPELSLRTTSHHRGDPLLASLDGLSLPADDEDVAMVVPVLEALAYGAGTREIPVLEPERFDARWAVLAELFRAQQGHNGYDDQVRRKELALTLERRLLETSEPTANDAFFRDLAELVWSRVAPCTDAEPALLELTEREKANDTIRVVSLLTLATCLVDGDEVTNTEAAEAEVAISKALEWSGQNPCVRVSAIGTISRIDMVRGGNELWNATSALLPAAATCDPAMWSQAYAARGNALAGRKRWCDAADAHRHAFESFPRKLEPLLNWAEYAASCQQPAGKAEVLEQLRLALESTRFDRPDQSVSIAYLRWWLSHQPADAQRVIDLYAKVKPGEPALIEGVASTLEPAICKGRTGNRCSYTILTRGKQPDSESQLGRSLGLR